MPWIAANLRGQRVVARVKADGSFASTAGRVEVRYKPTDPRVYRASERNLERIAGDTTLMPDDAVVDGEDVAAASKAKGKEERSAARKADAAAKALAPGAVPADAWTVYVDGACSGNPGPAGLGIVLITPDKKTRVEGSEYLGSATNNVAELTAVLRALQLVPAGARAVVHTDSQYAIGILTKAWKPKANQDLVATLRTALTARRGTWRLVYVPGHSGVPLNERADALAVEAVSSRSSRMPTAPIAAPPPPLEGQPQP